MNEKILVLDFGGQYNQLIARRVRDFNVYAEILPYTTDLEKIKANGYKGIIFTGGPNSVFDMESPHYTKDILDIGVPILGICYGCQLIAWMGDGKVATAPISEYGKIELQLSKDSLLWENVPEKSVVWMSHTDYISEPPKGFEIIAKTDNCPCAAMQNVDRKIYAVQFHPEVTHSEYGNQMLRNFVFNVCGCTGDWKMDSFIDTTVEKLREKIGDKKVVLGLSGGVDSSVVAALLIKAIGKQLICVHVNHGLLRKGEPEQVIEVFQNQMDANLIYVDAVDRFLDKLAGISDPEQKRKIIGKEFIDVFAEEAQKLEGISFLAQGTIYPDILESDGIKSHHNVGGLPEDLQFELVEPVKLLYKDEVRVVGKALGLPDNMVYRQPFPGPGLGVRCIGAITRDRLEAVRESDAILREEFAKNGLEGKVWQYFTVVPDIKSTGIIDGKRSFDWPVIIRAVNTVDAVTAEVAQLDFGMMQHIVDRITHEVSGVNRVLWDLTPKPTGTIEWE